MTANPARTVEEVAAEVMAAEVMVAEVISIGDEMTSGARLDTNGQWLSTMLGELGVRVLYHSTVGDSLEACKSVFEIAAGRASIVVMTGGLGPTADDLTREALAAAAGTTLEFRQAAMDHIESLFARRNRDMPERNRVQAMFPVGSEMIPNPQGTAPGIDISIQRGGNSARFFSLPGVPAEMQQMWLATVAPAIRKQLGPAPTIRRAVVKCFGLGESEMESRLGGMIARQRSPQVGITVSRATIALRIEAIADSDDEALRQIESVKQDIYSRVGDFVFGEGDDYELPDAVLSELARRNESICVVELGLDCLLASWLTACDGGLGRYRGGIHAQKLEDVCRMLGAEETTTVAAAKRMLRACDSDWCVVVDHYPSLIPVDDKPLPAADVRVVLCHRDSNEVLEYADQLGGHPDILQPRVAKAALHHVFKSLRDREI